MPPGYKSDPEAVAGAALSEATDMESAADIVTESLKEFLRVESIFADKLLDDVVRDLTKANEENLDLVIDENLAHQQLAMRSQFILALLRQVESFNDRFGVVQLPADRAIEELAKLPTKSYGEIALAADTIIRKSKVPPFEGHVSELRSVLLDPETKYEELTKSSTLSSGVDLLTNLFADEDAVVRASAVETYVHCMYHAHRIQDVTVEEKDGQLTCSWTFRFTDVEEMDSVLRRGLLSVVSSLDDLKEERSL